MHTLLQQLIRVRPNGAGDTEIFYVQGIIPASLEAVDRHGRTFIIADRDYPIATTREAAEYWKTRAECAH